MINKVSLVSATELKFTFLELLRTSKGNGDADMVRVAVSVIEYLKDAQRWHYAENNTLPDTLSGKALREYVDKELNK